MRESGHIRAGSRRVRLFLPSFMQMPDIALPSPPAPEGEGSAKCSKWLVSHLHKGQLRVRRVTSAFSAPAVNARGAIPNARRNMVEKALGLS